MVNRVKSKIVSKDLKPKIFQYYFGYYPIVDSLKFNGMPEYKKERYKAKMNYILSNKTNPLSIKGLQQSSRNFETLFQRPAISLNLSGFKNFKKIYSKHQHFKFFETNFQNSLKK